MEEGRTYDDGGACFRFQGDTIEMMEMVYLVHDSDGIVLGGRRGGTIYEMK